MTTNNSGLKMHKDFYVCVWIWSRVNWLACLIQAPEVETLTVSAALTQLETERTKEAEDHTRKENGYHLPFSNKIVSKENEKIPNKNEDRNDPSDLYRDVKSQVSKLWGTLCERAVCSLRRGYFLSSSVFQTAFSHYLQSSFERLTRIFISSSSCRRR